MSTRKNLADPRVGFTAAERAWLDEARSRWQPFTESQVSTLRRVLGPIEAEHHASKRSGGKAA